MHLHYWFLNNIIEIPLPGGRGHIFSLCAAILTRLGVTIFKMPPSTAVTVNQFSNPKVSDVEREGEAEEGQGGHLLFLIRMDQSSSPFLSPLYLSISGTLFLFLGSLSSLYSPPPPPATFPLPHFGSPPRDFNGSEEGCHFKMSSWWNKGPAVLHVFPLHHPFAVWLYGRGRCVFGRFHTFDLQRKRTVVTSLICHFIKREIINSGHKAGECRRLSPAL